MTHLVIAPILLPLLTGLLLLLLHRQDIRWSRALGLIAGILQIALAITLWQAVRGGDILIYALGNWQAPYGIVLVADQLAVWMVLITSLLALFALLYACRGVDQAGRHFPVLFQLQLFGLQGAFLTGDLFNLFVFFEILLLASYGLLLHGSGPQRTRAGLHFVIVNLVGSSLFLFAIGTLYGTFGTLNMADLARHISQAGPEQLGLARLAGLLLFAVFALKAALVPLHLWLPAAYSSATAPVAALFVVMTKVGAYGILRLDALLYGQGAAADLLHAWLLPVALVTLALATLGVMASSNLRRQVAWLVVVSIGSLLTAFALGDKGIAAGLYYLPHSTFAAAAFFLLADSIARRRGQASDQFIPDATLADRRLLGGLFFFVAILIVGLPPLSGFVGKFLILRAAVDSPATAWVLAVLLVGGLLTLIALARSGSLLFYRSRAVAPNQYGNVVRLGTELLPAAGLLLLCMGLLLWAGPLEAVTRAIAEQVQQPQLYIRAVLGGLGQ